METEGWCNGTVAGLAARAQRLLVTRGKDGADEWAGGRLRHSPIYEVGGCALGLPPPMALPLLPDGPATGTGLLLLATPAINTCRSLLPPAVRSACAD